MTPLFGISLINWVLPKINPIQSLGLLKSFSKTIWPKKVSSFCLVDLNKNHISCSICHSFCIGYLLWTKIPNTDPAQFSVSWGIRAEKEVSKMDCLKFVCEVFSYKSEVEVSPKDWQVQYKEAMADEGEEEMEEG